MLFQFKKKILTSQLKDNIKTKTIKSKLLKSAMYNVQWIKTSDQFTELFTVDKFHVMIVITTKRTTTYNDLTCMLYLLDNKMFERPLL